ncbi:MAG: hypothetical protein CL943_02755 [Candidatus Diapherotrites archaeon]|uniref:HIT domain-containing protein n=1 Tax=Candidatus Iainarchaeum sp. TaxID=3101447 RepID=A0A2D6M1D3_9ARCH|nr:hypothetical protein [Candidatus Diapherotrites archaeon]|tara:strand:- start:4593 stop:5225 length:633 start_codon:yes stop_codon:yes gene_type:complete
MTIKELIEENIAQKEDCNLCRESSIEVGEKTEYGAVIISRIGKGLEDGWFATISPKTGSNPEKDFSIQLMSFAHLTHFAQLAKYPELAKNYGVLFSKVSMAMAQIMAEENPEFKPIVESKELGTSMATYGKCTNWGEKKEHLHIKVFPFKGNIGQPYTVDSSFGRKEAFEDPKTKEKFVKMKPVTKVVLSKERFEQLSKKLIGILSDVEQ